MYQMANFFFAEEYCLYRNVLAVVGVMWAVVKLMRLGRFFIGCVRGYFLSPLLGVGRIDLSQCGSWAVVTGASEGIGRGYALELARQGLNVVLMSRSKEKLQKVADTIQERYKKEVLIIPVDFSDLDIYEGISQQLEGLDIGVLVNNVGMFFGMPDKLGNVPQKSIFDVVQVNTHPVVQMAKLVLPRMLKMKRGVILNVSSATSNMAVPRMLVYSATKIFTNYVSEGLRKECATHGIIVQAVIPCFVATKMSGIKPNLLVPDAESYARSAVATIGVQDETMGCFGHAIQYYIVTSLPLFVKNWIGWQITGAGRKSYKAKSK